MVWVWVWVWVVEFVWWLRESKPEILLAIAIENLAQTGVYLTIQGPNRIDFASKKESQKAKKYF